MIRDMTIANQTIVSRLTARYYSRSGTDPLDAAFCDYARPGMTVLDAGCGGLRGCAREAPCEQMYIIGVDREPAVYSNPFCDEKIVCNLESLPFEDRSFDLIHCRWVLEHLREPLKIFREFARILKPSGRLLALTPNIFHYAMIAAMVTPQRFHRWWRRGQYEPFETYYRANTPAKLRRLCAKAGLSVQRLELIEEQPDYLARYWPAFLCGVLYERTVNSTPLLEWMRQRILLVAGIADR
jgi:ubiquinone/menaquinone biosynthesis C-methylase UbiE